MTETPEAINIRELMEYYGLKGVFGRVRLYLRQLKSYVLQALAMGSPLPGLTVLLQRARGVKIGKHVYIGPGVMFDELYPQLIAVEDYVSIGMQTLVFAHSNPTCSLELKQNYFPRKVAPTAIKKGAWIPPRCVILAGVTIGENAVIGAGSVVIRDVDPYTIVAGVPAKVVRDIREPAVDA